MAGKALKDADLRRDSLVVLIQRNGSDLIPDGDTVIQADDLLVLFTRRGT